MQIPSYTGEFKSFEFRFEDFIRHFQLKSQEALYSLKALEQDGWINFNEKSFSPSTVMITTTKDALYEFESAHPSFEPLLTTILRTYEGVFDFPAYINEGLLARLLRKEETSLVQELKTLASFGMIRYVPQNESPQVIFLKHRVPASELEFKITPYNKRKEIFIERMHAMTGYADAIRCRSRYIAEYFGEADAGECGICDFCLKKKAVSMSTEEFEKISQMITTRLSRQPFTAIELLDDIRVIQKEKAWQVLRFLQSENKITFDATGVLRLN